MEEMKMWHEDDGITFHAQTKVYFSYCDKTGFLSLYELLRLTSDIAVEDYRARGMSREFLLQNNFAILVSRVSFKLLRLPKENESITVSTWEEVSEALQLIRGYEITDNEGNALVEGLSSWLLVDPKTRRIIPSKKFALRPPSSIKRQDASLKPSKIILPDDMEKIGEHTIAYSDLDANGHTNNSRYAAFIMDNLPEPYASRKFTDFKINYSKEALSGEKIELFAHYEDNKIILVGKTQNGNSFESELYF